MLKRAIKLDPTKRYRDAVQMQAVFERAQSHARKQRRASAKGSDKRESEWRQFQWRQFQRDYREILDTRFQCRHCEGPVAESMQACPWCGFDNPARSAGSAYASSCPRCERGVKNDWLYCPWCYGPGFTEETSRRYRDKRYTARCANRRCRGPLMPFMRYCPWCRAKVHKPWKIPGSRQSCRACSWGIAREFWNYCAWCREPVRRG